MYNNYTPLQQRQLALQEYSNTQSTYLLVCASARSTALKATLTDQLHRKFRLVDRLDGELTASVDGVLLAAEDVELMSTALMYFAKALQDGADYVVCNAVFGFGGATALYQSSRCRRRTAAPWSAAPCWSAAAPPPMTPKMCPSCWRWPRSSALSPLSSRRLCSTTSAASAPRMRFRPTANVPLL